MRSRPGSAPSSSTYGRTGGGAITVSPTPGPSVASSSAAVSRTVRLTQCWNRQAAFGAVRSRRDAALARLEPDEAATRRGDADRPAAVARVGERHHPRRDGCGRPSRLDPPGVRVASQPCARWRPRRPTTTSTAAAAALARIADNVERVIRGKRDVVELVLALPGGRGAPPGRGRPRRGQDQPGQGPRPLARRVVRAHPVHPRPAALRRRRRLACSTASDAGVQLPARAGVRRRGRWPTRSTGPRPRPSRRCSRRWPRSRSPSTASPTPCRRPFVVIATQNPIEHEGTYALPESQLDRFLMRVGDRLPGAGSRARPAREPGRRPRPRRPRARGRRRRARRTGRGGRRPIHVAPALRHYLVDLADASRRHPDLGLGMSPRATLSLLRVSRVRALSAGRAFATPDDVKALVRPVLAHRLTTSGDARLRGVVHRRRARRADRHRPHPPIAR